MALKSETSKTVNSNIGFSVKDILDLPATKKLNEDKRNNLDTENLLAAAAKNSAIDFPTAAAHLAGSSFFNQSLPASFYKYGASPADLLNLSGTLCKFSSEFSNFDFDKEIPTFDSEKNPLEPFWFLGKCS